MLVNRGPLKTATVALKGIGKHVTAEKERLSLLTMKRLTLEDRWPADDLQVDGYIGRTQNRKFRGVRPTFGYLKANPQLFRKTIVFEPRGVGRATEVLKAIQMAYALVTMRARQYQDTGWYRSSFVMMAWDARQDREFEVSPNDPNVRGQVYTLLNEAEYASSLEAHVYRRMKEDGIMHHVAQRVKRAFPQLIVQFSYGNLDSLGLGLSHRYAVPYIRIGLRGGKLRAKIRKPGRNIMRRNRAYSKMGPYKEEMGNYHRLFNAHRRGRGFRRIDDRHFGDDLVSYQAKLRRELRRRR